jgi:putative heme-binding domain-containing protein
MTGAVTDHHSMSREAGPIAALVGAAARLLRSPSIAAVLVAIAWNHAPLRAQEAVAAPVDVEDGQRLYLSACTNCHGPDGDAVPGVDLGHSQFRRASSDAELADIVRRGIPGTAMPPGNYSSRQASLIVAYLRSMATTGQKATATGDPTRGKALFEGRGQCLTCHQVQGNGSRLGSDLTEIGRLRRVSELERALVDPAPEVRPQNRMARVVTRDGATITGRLLHHDTFTLLILDSQEELRAFDKADVRDMAIVKSNPKTSYRGRLTAQELADLVGYLVTLKGTRAVRP